jgi:hypothetical protein
VSERKTTVWSLSAARIPDILVDAFSALVVKHFEGVAVEDAGDITSDFAVVSPNKRNSLSKQISMRRPRLEEAREISWAPQVIRYLIR